MLLLNLISFVVFLTITGVILSGVAMLAVGVFEGVLRTLAGPYRGDGNCYGKTWEDIHGRR
jgi:hypothetical protein